MARPLRIEVAGGLYHLTARGNERRPIYRVTRDREHFLELLAELPSRFGTLLHAWMLMNNHYHLVIETPEPNLSRVGQWLNVSYGMWFNCRHDRSGHLFQGRFKAALIEDNAGLMEVVRYVHLNPARVGRLGLSKQDRARQKTAAAIASDPRLIEERLKVLREYAWSSYPAYLGKVKPMDLLNLGRVMSCYSGKSLSQQREALRKYTEDPVREGIVESPWERLIGGVILGSEEFAAQLRDRVKGSRREQKSLKVYDERVAWDRIVRAVESVKGEKWEAFRDRYGDWGRDAALYLGRRQGRMKLLELSQVAGGVDYAAVGGAISRFGKRLIKGELRTEMKKILTQLSNT